jgi:hypothetical protein
MYNFRGFPYFGGVNTSGVAKYSLMASKACCCSCPHTNSSLLFNLSNGENAFVLPATLEINLL